ncbi:MAG: hypothetical protein LKK08_08015 [Bacteroidales bacterium]|nr:hypothetical protein [Bacteroidales bacterium]MCI2146166.1 hypothetical protein [Bacteroidales bacterium]
MEKDSKGRLEELKSNIGLLISKLEIAKTENRRLSEKLQINEKELVTSKNKIANLEKQIENLQFANAFSASSSDRKEAKAKVGKLIWEIDKCMALLDYDKVEEHGRESEAQD